MSKSVFVHKCNLKAGYERMLSYTQLPVVSFSHPFAPCFGFVQI